MLSWRNSINWSAVASKEEFLSSKYSHDLYGGLWFA